MNRFWLAFFLCCLGQTDSDADADVTIYNDDLAAFNLAAGNPPIAISFENLPFDNDITGQTIHGVTFSGPGSPLIVVRDFDTFATGQGGPEHQLISTTPDHILSPGGRELAFSDPALQNDDLLLTFENPISSFGLDLLWQSADGAPLTTITVRNRAGAILYSADAPIPNLGGPGAPAGNSFWGVVSTQNDIYSIEIDEMDNGVFFPDSNLGFDTFRFRAIPEPSTFGLLPLLCLFGRRRSATR